MTFHTLRQIPLPEIQCTLTEVEHQPTGAKILHLAADDEENLFCLSFRTWPQTSNGVAHILEHTVLCGSEHFPLRDPFFSMNRRSLNTFMNAFTGGDFTCYPAASQIPKDFENLLTVYLDAAFHPRLLKSSFLQEGHRLEFEEPENPNSPLCFKGVVYNEMKGALATGDARLGEALMQALFPDVTYGVNSGGDPKEIPSLTYQQLKAFHAKFYHPSHCLFFFYGNIPLEKHLEFLQTHLFQGIERAPPLPPLPAQPRFIKPKIKTLSYPATEEEDKTLVGMSWLTCSTLDQETLLALNVLDILLMGTDASPLKQALLKSDLCKQADSDLEGEMSEVPFSLICRGCAEDAGPALETLVHETLTQILQEGFDPALVEGAVHQLELSRSEIHGNSSPYGLILYFRSALLSQHGGKPEEGLQIHSLFDQLRKRVAHPTYLSQLIKTHLLNNPHFVRITMLPDPSLASQEAEEEEAKLQKLQTQLTKAQTAAIIDDAKELLASQEAKDPVDLLPKISLTDVPKTGKEFALHTEKHGALTLHHHPCFSNGLFYADLNFDLPAIAKEDLPLVRLFGHLLPQVGCGGKDYKAHLDDILKHTGGVSTSLDLGAQADDPSKIRPSLSLRLKGLHRKAPQCFALLCDMVETADFTDEERLSELLMQHFHAIETGLERQSLRYAIHLAARGLSVPSYIQDSWFGFHYYEALKTRLTQEPRSLITQLQKMQQQLLGLQGAELVLSCDQKLLSSLKTEGFYGLTDIPSKSFAPWRSDYPLPEKLSQGRITSSPVAFTALLFPSVAYAHPDAAALSIASELMDNVILHKRIREQGGAYGGGSASNLLSGQFYFYGYRDPHIQSTLDAFQEAIDTLIAGSFTDEELEEAKLGIFQGLDAPTPPGSRALLAHSRQRSGRTAKKRQAYREALFATDTKSLITAAKKHLKPGIKQGVTATFAGKELLEKETSLPIFSL